MRPNLLDFSSEKALENLRIRRLQHRGDVVAAEPSTEKVATTGTAGDATVSRPDSVSWTNSHESWTDRDTRSSPRPRRRWSASASTLREGLEERPTSHIRMGPRRGSESAATLGKRYDEKPWSDFLGNTKHDPEPRPWRPRSAKATLQQSPTHSRQLVGDNREAFRDDHVFLRNTMTKRSTSHATHVDTRRDPRPQPGVDMDRAVEFYNQATGGFGSDYSREGRERRRSQEPESVSGDMETGRMSPAAAEERAWLLDR